MSILEIVQSVTIRTALETISSPLSQLAIDPLQVSVIEEEKVEIEIISSSPMTETKVWVGYQPLVLSYEKESSREVVYRYTWEVGFFAGEAHAMLSIGTKQWRVAHFVVAPRTDKLAAEEYTRMLEELQQKLPQLYDLSPVHKQIGLHLKGPRYYAVLAEQLCQMWPSLHPALQQIADRPSKKIVHHQKWRRFSQVRSSAPSVYRDYITGRKKIPANTSPQVEEERVQDRLYQVTEQTFENLAVTGFLSEARRIIQQILDYFGTRTFPRHKQLLRVYQELSAVMKTEPFCTCRPTTERPKPTLLFRKDARYYQVYQCYQKLRKGIAPLVDTELTIPLLETFTLYEYWCFLRIIEILEKIETTSAHLVSKGNVLSGVFQTLSYAEAVIGSYRVFFQKRYRYTDDPQGSYSISHEMIPDIVVERGEKRWLFDAKYRASYSALNEALNDMHKYRDAIQDETGEKCFQHTYILCPSITDVSMRKRYTDTTYQKKYGLGIIETRIGQSAERLEEIMRAIPAKEVF